MNANVKRVYLLYGLSGLVSLSYQVAWFRIYVDWFGSTNLTFAMVLCNFIGGLGVGALVSQPVTGWLSARLKIRDGLRLYGVVELLVAASVLLLLVARIVPANAWGQFPYELQDGIYASTMLMQLSKLGIAALCVFVPCFFMGVTFPLLCQIFGDRDTFPSTIYGWNTLGACSGVLLCEFVLLPWVGHDMTLWLAVAVNGLLGAFFLATGGAPTPAASAAVPSSGLADPALSTQPERSGTLYFGALLACGILSGLLAGSLEADMFKRVSFLSNASPAAMSFISFWAILAIFLASWTVRALPRLSLGYIKGAYLLALLVYALTWLSAHGIQAWFVERAYAPLVESLSDSERLALSAGRFPTSLGQVLLFAGVFVFPAYLLISLLLPFVCNRLQSGRRHLGLVYGANTLAFCFGMVAFTWLAPRVSIFYSMKLMMVVLAIGAGLLLLIRENRRIAPWKPALALVALGAGCVLTPAGFDRSYVTPDQLAALYPVRAMKSNGTHTTYVVAAPDGDRLYFDNHSMSGTNHAAQVYMRLMAHFPLLAHPDPKRVLLICFGVGNTADAISCHDTVEAIDVVDLNDKVIATAPEFARYNHEVYLDPRVRFIHDDGRNFLNTTDITYDLITSEPPPPMFAGVYRLYSTEYYAQARARLSSAGMMTQWLPIHEMPQEAVDLAVATFVDAFPHSLLFVGHKKEYILIGSLSPIDLGQIERRLGEQPAVAADLGRLGLRGALQLIARVTKGQATLEREFGGQPLISDQHNDLTYLFTNPLKSGVVSYDPAAMLSDIDAADLPIGDSLRSVVMDLGRLRYVADFPYETLATVGASGESGAKMADADWAAIQALETRSARLELLEGEGKVGPEGTTERIGLLREALTMGAEQPEFLMKLAGAYAALGSHDQVIANLTRFQLAEPTDPKGFLNHGLYLASTGEFIEAIPVLEHALELVPTDAEARFALAQALEATGDLARSVTQYGLALDNDPNHVDAHLALGVLLARGGSVDQALVHWEKASVLDPRNPHVHHNMGIARKGKGQLTKAIVHYREAVRLEPEFAQAQKSLGAALLEANQLQEALEPLRAAARLNPRDEETRQILIQLEAALQE
ncbi:MAG: spermidine synthase [Chlamydiales bacterium]